MRVRIACLHGGCANAEILRRQLKRLLEAMAEEADFIFLEGALLTEEVRLDDTESIRFRFGAACCDFLLPFIFVSCSLRNTRAPVLTR